MATNTDGNEGTKIDINKNTKDGKKGEERTKGRKRNKNHKNGILFTFQ